MVRELARAKVNLCLHVTGQRDDGMHLLDSLVVFPNVGDRLEISAAPELTLEIDGPFGAALEGDNLILQAARLLLCRAAIRLEKNLPVAAGIGGGSADAAAALRGLCRLYDLSCPDTARLVDLGADVPVCMDRVPVRMQGIGEKITPLPDLPPFWIVLVNAGEGVNTGAVFARLEGRNNAPVDSLPKAFSGPQDLFGFLERQRNDMQAAACRVSPVIMQVLAVLADTTGCALARMSGSGGTCFGLYARQEQAAAAAAVIHQQHPRWWAVSARV